MQFEFIDTEDPLGRKKAKVFVAKQKRREKRLRDTELYRSQQKQGLRRPSSLKKNVTTHAGRVPFKRGPDITVDLIGQVQPKGQSALASSAGLEC